jgi:hypothetical protein
MSPVGFGDAQAVPSYSSRSRLVSFAVGTVFHLQAGSELTNGTDIQSGDCASQGSALLRSSPIRLRSRQTATLQSSLEVSCRRATSEERPQGGGDG